MAQIDKVKCPICIFTARYIDMILTADGYCICPNCNARFSYEELMQLFSFTQYTQEIKEKSFKPTT